MFVAQELRKVAVEDQSFGLVGLCDLKLDEGEPRASITSLNRIYATLRLDDLVSKQLEVPAMSRLIEIDFAQVKKLELSLRDKIKKRVSSAVADNNNSIFEKAYKLAAGSSKSDEELIDLRIKLGSLKSAEFNSGMPVSGDPSDVRIAANGTYLAGVDIPITSTGTARFYQLAPETQLVINPEFVEAQGKQTPSAVLIEATFKSSNRNHRIDVVQTRSAVIMLGGINTTAPNSVLMVSFPQGMPGAFHSLRALVSAKSENPGSWQQAAGGSVPGSGRLAAAFAMDTTEMTSEDALQTAYYHWLRSLGPKPRMDAIERLFNYSWSNVAVPADDTDQTKPVSVPNSALTKDTGARAFAVFYQSGPGGAGQAVLRNAFDAGPSSSFLPHSAIPLDVDQHGNCNFAGRTGFDRKLIADLLELVYETNLVATESTNVAKSVIKRLDRAEEQANRSIDLTNEELSSISNRRLRLEMPGEASAELKSLRKSEDELRTSISSQRAKRAEYQEVKERANQILLRAETAAQSSFDLCANMSRYAQDGVFRCEDNSAFLLGSEYVFRPISRSVTEDEIYKISGKPSVWLSLVNVLEPAPDDLVAEGLTALERRSKSSRNRASARFVVMEARTLSRLKPSVLVLSHSPFADSGIPSGQLAYYAQDAFNTGQDPPVGWSLLIRDAVARLNTNVIFSSQNKWCMSEEQAVSSCPTLAVEIQVRSPVPLIPDLPVGSFVVNPTTHERMSQIPPMPANML